MRHLSRCGRAVHRFHGMLRLAQMPGHYGRRKIPHRVQQLGLHAMVRLAEAGCADCDVVPISGVQRAFEFLGRRHERLAGMLGVGDIVVEVLGVCEEAELLPFGHPLGAVLGPGVVVRLEHRAERRCGEDGAHDCDDEECGGRDAALEQIAGARRDDRRGREGRERCAGERQLHLAMRPACAGEESE